MDPLTHALSGALLARATAAPRADPRALPVRRRVAAGLAAAAFPDADFALRLIDTITYLNWHQGITHSLVMLPVWALLFAHLFARLDPAHPRWRAYYGPASLGLAIHIAGDLITAYGLMLFAPLSTQRFSLPLAFVIDTQITAIIVCGLLGAALLPRVGRAIGALALAALGGYVAFLALQQRHALAVGEAYASALGLPDVAIHALPQPPSPFNWKTIIAGGDTYHVANVGLDRRRQLWPPASAIPWLRAIHSAYAAPHEVHWQRIARFGDGPAIATLAREAWSRPEFTPYRRFAVFPRFDGLSHDDGPSNPCAWFVDIRFEVPQVPPSFRFGMCRDGTGAWQMRRMRGAFWID
ncbi:MAG TPA: metal-dependent hydrolase [Rhodocyclaceae bacterium]|nr:metal-dependent hydrolase [Rhodocyclaceae bacterium]